MSEPENVRLTRRGRTVLALSLVGLLVGVPVIGGYLYGRAIGVFGESDPGKVVEVVIDEGSSAGEIGSVLEKKGVIASAFGFRLAAKLEGGAEKIQAGRYEIATNLTARDALTTLVEDGPVIEFVQVTFPEGSWLTDFARILDRETHLSDDRFLELATSGEIRSNYQPEDISTLEGLLFPSTYQIVENDTEESVLQRLVNQFDKEADAAGIAEAEAKVGVTPYEAIVFASMIEAEASAAGDRNKIAAVLYNRVEEDMKLEIDATVLYALGEHKEELTVSDLQVDSPYNTRLYPGIPPTPIGAPGSASLEAVMNPASGDWLYYVLADCEGNHFFAADYDDFLNAKARYQALDC
jgi:UPF0755 protein